MVLCARRFIVGASPELKFRTTDEADTAHEVSGLLTGRKPWYIFSPDLVQIATFLACNASTQQCLFWIDAECICRRRFHYSVSFVLFLSKGASKAKIVWHLTYQCCYKFWLYTFLFCSLFFQNFPKFLIQNFFSKISFHNFFFEGSTLDASPFIETKRTLCICVMKNMIYSKRSSLNFRLVWCVRYSFSAHTTHITLDVKSSISSPHRIILLYFFSKSAIFNWSTQMFSRWHLIAKCIKFWLKVDTPIFLYNHSDTSVKFVGFAD